MPSTTYPHPKEARSAVSKDAHFAMQYLAILMRMLQLRFSQQVGERGDAAEAAEIVNDLEYRLDLTRVAPGQRHQRAELGVDIGPGDAEHARSPGCVDRV